MLAFHCREGLLYNATAGAMEDWMRVGATVFEAPGSSSFTVRVHCDRWSALTALSQSIARFLQHVASAHIPNLWVRLPVCRYTSSGEKGRLQRIEREENSQKRL